MFHYKYFFILLLALITVACSPQTQTIEVTRLSEVTREVEVINEIEATVEVEVTREVAVEVTREVGVEAEVNDEPVVELTLDEKIASAMSAAPVPIAQDATILDYPAEWPGNWPNEPAPELIELQAGTNGWTCIADAPDTEGNDPMCLNDVYLEVLLARLTLTDAPSSGIGFGYMFQEGVPAGSPPHMMVFVPESNSNMGGFTTEPSPMPWVMFPDTSYQHLMVLTPPRGEKVAASEDKIANAMSAAPVPIAQDATILDYPAEWPGNWPNEPAPELIELQAGTNGWTCIVDIPDTEGNDPMCLNDVYLEVLLARYALTDAPATGIGFGYMLQGGAPDGSPAHMMIFAPESNESMGDFTTESGPMPWVMFPDTSYQHLMVLTQ